MDNKESYLENGIKVIHTKINTLLNSVKEYYEDLEMFRRKVQAKMSQNPVEEQVKQDMLLNINTLMDKVQIDAIDPLIQQQEILLDESNNKLTTNTNKSTEFMDVISLKVNNLKKSIVSLKTVLLDFLSRNQFGKRHGFTTFFNNSDKLGPTSKPH